MSPFVWGVALANFVNGVPLNSSNDYAGDFWDLFSPYTVFAGLAVVLLFAFHGACYLTLRTTGELCERAARAARRLAVPAAVGAGGLLAWTVAVAVDRNDKDVFPPVLPAALGIAVLLLAVRLRLQAPERLGVRDDGARNPRRGGHHLHQPVSARARLPPGLRQQPDRVERGLLRITR